MKIILHIIYIGLLIMGSTITMNAQSELEQEIELQDGKGKVDFNQESHKEIGLNFTQFIAQFIPLNVKDVKAGPIGYSFKRYNARGLAFRFGFGARIEDNFENSFLGIRLGYERRKPLSKNFYYTRGWDAMFVVGSLNLPNFATGDDEGTIGFGPVIGLEYHLSNSFVLSTESMLFIGAISDGPVLNVLPPTALMLNFRF